MPPRSSKPRVFSSKTKTAAFGRLFCWGDFSGRRAKPLTRMARETGLEPAASAVTGRRSNQLSYSRGCRNQLDPRKIEGIKASLRLVKAVANAWAGSRFLPQGAQREPGFSAEIGMVSLVPNRIMPESPRFPEACSVRNNLSDRPPSRRRPDIGEESC